MNKKYIVVEIQKAPGGDLAFLVTKHDSKALALQKYHTILAAAAVSGLPSHSATMLNEDGTPARWDTITTQTEEEPS